MSTTEDIYTPTTDDVQEAYANWAWNDGLGRAGLEVDAELQRWLTAHDTATRNSALEEATTIVNRQSCVPIACKWQVHAAIRRAKEETQ